MVCNDNQEIDAMHGSRVNSENKRIERHVLKKIKERKKEGADDRHIYFANRSITTYLSRVL